MIFRAQEWWALSLESHQERDAESHVKVRWLGLEREARERVKYESYTEYRALVCARLLREVNAQVASAEGEKGGEFYTPTCLMRLLVEMPEPCGEATDNTVGEAEHSMLSNPPYGKSWKSDLEWRGGKDGIKDPRFVIEYVSDPEHSLLTRSSEGQMLFLANMLAKMKDGTPPGSCIAEVRNGASVFTSDAGHFTSTTTGAAR